MFESLSYSTQARLGTGIASYPLHRTKLDPNYASQSHSSHMKALVEATHKATASAHLDGKPTSEELGVETLWRGASDTAT